MVSNTYRPHTVSKGFMVTFGVLDCQIYLRFWNARKLECRSERLTVFEPCSDQTYLSFYTEGVGTVGKLSRILGYQLLFGAGAGEMRKLIAIAYLLSPKGYDITMEETMIRSKSLPRTSFSENNGFSMQE